MSDRRMTSTVASIAALCLLFAPNWAKAASAPFPPSMAHTLPNGVAIVSQSSPDTSLVSVNVFLPAGLSQQPVDRAGVAGVTAAMVLATPVEKDQTLADVSSALGAALSYTIDPQDTRYSIECKAADLPPLLADLAHAIAAPGAAGLSAARSAALRDVRDAISDPTMTTYGMVRQAQFDGSSYARPDRGTPQALAQLTARDVNDFAALARRGRGTIVALAGDVTQADLDAAAAAFGSFPNASAPPGSAANAAGKHGAQEVVAHRDVIAPWVAIGYAAPSQFSSDFPAMLVIEALLGQGGDVHALSYGSGATLPDGFIGGYYQYEAEPGLFVEFYNGANVDRELHTLDDGVTRLQGSDLPAKLLGQAKTAALGAFLTSVTSLDDQSWLLGRAVMSPQGAGFANALTARINAVTAADVRRVARRYLSSQTIAVVLPNSSGQ